MHAEIASAASHVSTFLAPTSPSRSSHEAFKAVLTNSLQARYSNSWYVDDAQRGSASRALHWQPGPGGEGCSSPLLKACKATNTTIRDEEWTMWIDPGCVSVRAGPGPGRSSMHHSFQTDSPTKQSRFAGGEHFRVLYGDKQSPLRPRTMGPMLTVDFVPAVSKAAVISSPCQRFATAGVTVPSVTVCPSTPAVDADPTPGATPIVPWSKDASGESRMKLELSQSTSVSRRSSVSSAASSRRGSVGSVAYSTLSMEREQSASSIGTSIPATSPPTSASWCKLSFDEDDANQSSQPAIDPESPVSLSASLGPDSSDAELRGLGLEDVVFEDQDELGPEDALDERCNEGDDTLRPLDQADETVVEPRKKTSSILGHSRSSSSASNVTSFDNGNVGVLGGGVKLGGSGASSHNRSRAHSNASNASAFSQSGHRSRQRSAESRTYGWAQQQQNLQCNGLGLSNLNGGPSGVQQPTSQVYTFQPVAPSGQYLRDLQNHADTLRSRLDEAKLAFQQPRRTAPPLEVVPLHQRKEGPISSAPTTASGVLDTSRQMNRARPLFSQSFREGSDDTPKLSDGGWSAPDKITSAVPHDDGEADEDADENDPSACQDGGVPGKRVRTRGRRSRGRGAGRAARRAAAAAAAANGMSPAMLASPHLAGGHWSPSPVILQHSSMFQSPPILQHHVAFHPHAQPGPAARVPFAASFSPQVPQQQYHHQAPHFSPAMHPTRPFNVAQPGWHMNGEAR